MDMQRIIEEQRKKADKLSPEKKSLLDKITAPMPNQMNDLYNERMKKNK